VFTLSKRASRNSRTRAATSKTFRHRTDEFYQPIDIGRSPPSLGIFPQEYALCSSSRVKGTTRSEPNEPETDISKSNWIRDCGINAEKHRDFRIPLESRATRAVNFEASSGNGTFAGNGIVNLTLQTFDYNISCGSNNDYTFVTRGELRVQIAFRSCGFFSARGI